MFKDVVDETLLHHFAAPKIILVRRVKVIVRMMLTVWEPLCVALTTARHLAHFFMKRMTVVSSQLSVKLFQKKFFHFWNLSQVSYLAFNIFNQFGDSGQRCAGRNFQGRRCCTPENPCDEGEGDCDGPDDGGGHDGHSGCKGDLVCGSNNCKKFGIFYHEKDDCCEKPQSSTEQRPPPKIFPGTLLEPPPGKIIN